MLMDQNIFCKLKMIQWRIMCPIANFSLVIRTQIIPDTNKDSELARTTTIIAYLVSVHMNYTHLAPICCV